MQFTNHLSAGLCPDLLGELTKLGWLDSLAGCGGPSGKGRVGNENGRRERREKGE